MKVGCYCYSQNCFGDEAGIGCWCVELAMEKGDPVKEVEPRVTSRSFRRDPPLVVDESCHLIEGCVWPCGDVGDKIQQIDTNNRRPQPIASLTVWPGAHIPSIHGQEGDLYLLSWVKFRHLNHTVPHRISAAAAETGGRHDATGLLKQPQKAQLRTGSCNQVSRVCSPNGRHDRSLDAAAAAAAVMNDGGVRRRRRERQRFIYLSTLYTRYW